MNELSRYSVEASDTQPATTRRGGCLSQNDIISIMHDAVYTTLIVAAPLLGVGLLVGLLVSIFQATTQINEQTLSFVPKLIAIMVVLILCFGWMMTTVGGFTTRLFEFMATFGGQ